MVYRPLFSVSLPVVLFASVCSAQLATTDDGSQIAFASRWRFPGENTTQYQTSIYRGNSSSWKTVARSDSNPSPTTQVQQPFLSGDGSVTGWARYTYCTASCLVMFPRTRFEFEGLAKPFETTAYELSVSRNARFALDPGTLGYTDFVLRDLQSGQVWTYPSAPHLSTYGSSVADDGSVLGLIAFQEDQFFIRPVEPNRVAIWRPGTEPREIFQTEGQSVWAKRLSADGKRALIELTSGFDIPRDRWWRELWWIDIESGQKQRIARQASNGSMRFLEQTRRDISNDGGRVLFWWPTENNRLWVWDAGTAEARAVYESGEGIADAVLSGNGRVIWVMTQTGRLLRVDADTASVEQVLGALPASLLRGQSAYVPGSAITFEGRGADGLHFAVDGLEFPVINAKQQGGIEIQIPWEMADRVQQGATYRLLAHGDGNPFEMQTDIFLGPGVRPVLATDSRSGYAKAALPDFSALVSDEHPAIPGSTIHTWLYGLGPLDRPVATGAPGPSDPPAVPLAELACYITGRGGSIPARGLELPFIAYAPGLAGVYQVDMRIPEDWPAGLHYLTCESGRSTTWADLPVGMPR